MTRKRAVIATVLAVATLTGCGSGAVPRPAATSATSRSTPTAQQPPKAPPVGACYRLSMNDALSAASSAVPVRCTTPHTATTVYVGSISPVQDGHLLAISSARVQQQMAATCRHQVNARLGGSAEDRRLTRLQAIWFSPTPAQSDAGALWFRCDLILLAGPGRLGSLPARTTGLLDRPGSAGQYATCGTAAPGGPRFARVACSQPHSWRVRVSIDLGAGARFLSRAAGAAADSRCHDIEAGLASNSLHLNWSFEWPSRQQWSAGQRFGYCWTPDPA